MPKKGQVKYPIVGGKKECISCGHFLDLKNFYPSKSYYSHKCRKCTREHLLVKVGEKHCPKCQQTKPFQDFRPNKESYDRYCKLCRAEITRYRYHNDPEFKERWKKTCQKYTKKNQAKRTEYFKKWKVENPEKIKKIIEAYLPKQLANNRNYIQRNKERIYPKTQAWLREKRQNLDDFYIKEIFRHGGIRNPPAQLIKLKRLHILAKRIIKTKTTNHESHRTTRPNVASAI